MDANNLEPNASNEPKSNELARAMPGLPAALPRRIINVTPQAPAPPALSATPDAMSLLRALRRRWFLAGAVGCLAAVVTVAAAWYVLPPKFIASATIMISSRQQNGLDRTPDRQEHWTAIKTSADRIRSKDIILKMLNTDGIRNLRSIRKHPDAVTALAWVEENLKVEFKENSELINIMLSGEDPDDLRAIVSALTRSFMDVVTKEDKRVKADRLQRYERMQAEAKEKLREKVADKEGLVKLNNGKSAQAMLSEQQTARHRLDRAQEILSLHQFDLDKKNARLAVMQTRKADVKKLADPEIALKDIIALDGEGNLKKESEKVLRLEHAIDILRKAGHREDDSFLVQNQRELDKVKKNVDKRVAEIRADLVARVRAKSEADIDAAILEIRTEITPLEAHVVKYQKDVDGLVKAAQDINFWTGKLTVVEAEIFQQEKAANDLFQAVERAKVEIDAEPRIVQIGDAEWQPRDVKKRILMLLFAPLLALCGAVMAVGWWEFSARRVQGADELAVGLSMRVVGAIPELPDPRRASNGANPEADEIYRHNLVESIDAIRTMLLRNAPTDDIRTVMVTSAVGGEGKTTLASNLAMSLARAGRKTLLMDCDLRRPTAHQLFEQTLQPGFSEVALREVELPDAVRPTTTDPNLYLLPAGHWDREVIQELAKTGITAIFEKLRQEFDFIIVDSHPVLPATDSLLIGQHVDAVIVSVMRDVSQMHHVHTACQQLSTLGIRVFGAVVNGVPVKVYDKGYQYTAQPVA